MTALFGPEQAGSTGRAAGFLIRAALKGFAATLAGDLDLARRRPHAVVMRDTAGVTAELAQGCLAAAMAGTDLSHLDFLAVNFVSQNRFIFN